MAEHHPDHNREHIRAARETPDQSPHAIRDRVAAAAQRDGFLEHKEKRDAHAGRGDERQDHLWGEVHGVPSVGEVLPLAGPHRKWPRRIPTSTATMNAHAGWS